MALSKEDTSWDERKIVSRKKMAEQNAGIFIEGLIYHSNFRKEKKPKKKKGDERESCQCVSGASSYLTFDC